jgi:hypothetical protein
MPKKPVVRQLGIDARISHRTLEHVVDGPLREMAASRRGKDRIIGAGVASEREKRKSHNLRQHFSTLATLAEH